MARSYSIYAFGKLSNVLVSYRASFSCRFNKHWLYKVYLVPYSYRVWFFVHYSWLLQPKQSFNDIVSASIKSYYKEESFEPRVFILSDILSSFIYLSRVFLCHYIAHAGLQLANLLPESDTVLGLQMFPTMLSYWFLLNLCK